ncbi:sugar phosphate isomerase/epimerase [bacterium]|nr:sugar phosphate isomerase/epimerase [bacterium]
MAICVDTNHSNIKENLIEVIKLSGKRIIDVHISDNHGIEEEHLPPGDGIIDFPQVVRTLKNLGYKGPLTPYVLS